MTYGAEIKNGSNQIRLVPEDFLDTVVASGSATLVFNNAATRFEVFVAITGMLNNGRWAVSLWGGEVRYGIETGGFRIVSSDGGSPQYLVLRRGSV